MTKNFLRAIAACAIATVGQAAFALTYSYDFRTEFSGGTAPDGTAPWAFLTFQDVSPGLVSMNLSLLGLTAPEHVKDFYFNYGGTAPLTFTKTGGQAASISMASDGFKADGGGKYDVIFSFPTAASGDRFGAGESTSYNIAGSGVTAAKFNFQSSPSGGNGTWYSAMHVQNTGGNNKDSGFIGATVAPIPEPESYAMMLAGLVVVGFIARRRIRRA